MKIAVIFFVLLALATPASAYGQLLSCDQRFLENGSSGSGGTVDWRLLPSDRHHYDDSTDLGRAMNICDRHTQWSGMAYPEGGAPLPDYASGWEACYKVREKWNRSADAAKEREQRAQAERDKVFVKSVADSPDVVDEK